MKKDFGLSKDQVIHLRLFDNCLPSGCTQHADAMWYSQSGRRITIYRPAMQAYLTAACEGEPVEAVTRMRREIIERLANSYASRYLWPSEREDGLLVRWFTRKIGGGYKEDLEEGVANAVREDAAAVKEIADLMRRASIALRNAGGSEDYVSVKIDRDWEGPEYNAPTDADFAAVLNAILDQVR